MENMPVCTHPKASSWKCPDCHEKFNRYYMPYDIGYAPLSFQIKIERGLNIEKNYYTTYRPSSSELIRLYMCAMINKTLNQKKAINKSTSMYHRIVEHTKLQSKRHSEAEEIMGCKLLKFVNVLESSNLHQAKAVSTNLYKLLIFPDTNSRSSKQWFYFAVANTSKGQCVTFHILNFSKKSSLYTQHFKISIRSVKSGNGWVLGGDNISYYETDESIGAEENDKYYTLHFEHLFAFDDDTVYFAYSKPYTYSDHITYLHGVEVNNSAEFNMHGSYFL
jgi:hypothetical protein